MYDNTLTTVLIGDEGGDVYIRDFATVMTGFAKLVAALSKEIAPDTKINWVIDDLNIGSASASIVGIADEDGEKTVHEIVKAYENVGRSLEEGTPIPYSEQVAKAAEEITKVLNGQAKAIRFETAGGEATIVGPTGKSKKLHYTIGAVRGTVQTLSCRRDLRFTLYDNVFDQAVSCYFGKSAENLDDKMGELWGKRVIVAGRVGRDPDTGRPVELETL